jgi:hypothetical protein
MNFAGHNLLTGLDYANSVYSNATLNYTVVPKCASSVIIDNLKLKGEIIKGSWNVNEKKGGNRIGKKCFTFIRHPYERLKSYMYQAKTFTERDAEEKIKSIIHNFDNFNEHCIPYSAYISYNNFDFIGILERFDKDFKKISDIKIKKMSVREENNDIKLKVFNAKIDRIYNTVIEKHIATLITRPYYGGDVEVFDKARKCITPKRNK